jgi:hypothetical protein
LLKNVRATTLAMSTRFDVPAIENLIGLSITSLSFCCVRTPGPKVLLNCLMCLWFDFFLPNVWLVNRKFMRMYLELIFSTLAVRLRLADGRGSYMFVKKNIICYFCFGKILKNYPTDFLLYFLKTACYIANSKDMKFPLTISDNSPWSRHT